nr:MAG TPA: hypothetical protein [Caudoviricetes sp.]
MHALTISAFHYLVLRQRCKCEPLTHSLCGCRTPWWRVLVALS